MPIRRIRILLLRGVCSAAFVTPAPIPVQMMRFAVSTNSRDAVKLYRLGLKPVSKLPGNLRRAKCARRRTCGIVVLHLFVADVYVAHRHFHGYQLPVNFYFFSAHRSPLFRCFPVHRHVFATALALTRAVAQLSLSVTKARRFQRQCANTKV